MARVVNVAVDTPPAGGRRTTGDGCRGVVRQAILAGTTRHDRPLSIPPAVIDIAMPQDLPETGMPPGNDRFLWRLEVSGSVPGADGAAGVEVPVSRQRKNGR